MNLKFIVFLSIVLSSPALARDEFQNREIEFFTQTAEGQPIACGIQFTYLLKDDTYKQGQEIVVTGSIVLLINNASMIALIKLGGVDFPGGLLANKPVPFKIAHASVTIADKPLKPTEYVCENKNGQTCGYFTEPDSFVISEALETGGLTLNLNRAEGGLDYSLALDSTPDQGQDLNKYRSHC